jgi:cytosine/uracil/thiamine/allantoin permease
MSKSAANFVHALVAVLAGNAAYFLLEKYMPARARHVPLKIDLGMVVDFWFCLVVFGIIKTVAGWRRESKLPRP